MTIYNRLRLADSQSDRGDMADLVSKIAVEPFPEHDSVLLIFDPGTRAQVSLQLDDEVARKLLADLQAWARGFAN